MEVKVPNLGDGIESANVLSMLVKVGDSVSVDQTIGELETDKAVAPLPSTVDGVVESIHIQEGDVVKEGGLVLMVKGSGKANDTPSADSASPVSTPIPPVAAPAAPVVSASTSPQTFVDQADVYPDEYRYSSPTGQPVPASPYVRKVAQDLNIQLDRIRGTGNGGRVTIQDLQQYIAFLRQTVAQLSSQASDGTPVKPIEPVVDFSKWGDVRIEKASSLRGKIADKMINTWNSVPQVTQYGSADITDLMALRKKYKSSFEDKGLKLTLTVFALKVMAKALKEFPIFNSSYQSASNEIVYKAYQHIGVAVDTESGLIVPVIRDVDQKSMMSLAAELDDVADKARERRLSSDLLQGGSFTISNLGGLGAGAFSPIVNSPQVAILGLSKGGFQPVYNGKSFDPRLMMPISISYDHRVIDGADGARFIGYVQELFQTFDESLLKETT